MLFLEFNRLGIGIKVGVVLEVCVDRFFLFLLTLQLKLFFCELDGSFLSRHFPFLGLGALLAFRALNDRLFLLSFLALTFDNFSFALCPFNRLSTFFVWCHGGILGCFISLGIFFLFTKSLLLSLDFLFAELIDINVRFLVLRSGRVFVGHVHRAGRFGRRRVFFVSQNDGLLMTEVANLFLLGQVLKHAAPVDETATARISHEAGGKQRQRNLTQPGRHINLSNLNY